MKVTRPLVSVVDDDESVRESLPDLLKEFGFSAQAFSSAEEFLGSDCISKTRCLILDVAMPGMTGPMIIYGDEGRRQMTALLLDNPLRDLVLEELHHRPVYLGIP